MTCTLVEGLEKEGMVSGHGHGRVSKGRRCSVTALTWYGLA